MRSLQEQALKRKERLKALRDRQIQVSVIINVISIRYRGNGRSRANVL